MDHFPTTEQALHLTFWDGVSSILIGDGIKPVGGRNSLVYMFSLDAMFSVLPILLNLHPIFSFFNYQSYGLEI
jgi:hypothetical protein